MSTVHYEQSQLDRLGDHEVYRVKFWSDSGETKHMNIDRDVMAAIRQVILAATTPEEI